ncbi:hypothetical protein [Gordonia sp. (in: high G+C Gram-positive bacteria)]|uniref:hypothetical protein n=1 Tax=Gordonia sp. (in: high G+C Gram-positive bacteria) TaxID=84139 RepID=UPI0035280701
MNLAFQLLDLGGDLGDRARRLVDVELPGEGDLDADLGLGVVDPGVGDVRVDLGGEVFLSRGFQNLCAGVLVEVEEAGRNGNVLLVAQIRIEDANPPRYLLGSSSPRSCGRQVRYD